MLGSCQSASRIDTAQGVERNMIDQPHAVARTIDDKTVPFHPHRSYVKQHRPSALPGADSFMHPVHDEHGHGWA